MVLARDPRYGAEKWMDGPTSACRSAPARRINVRRLAGRRDANWRNPSKSAESCAPWQGGREARRLPSAGISHCLALLHREAEAIDHDSAAVAIKHAKG
jgi:hypothetical protein